MRFYVHRDPSNKLQKIPYAAMQIAGLADREDLTLQADEGCILLSHDHLSTRETIQTATLLKQVTIDLMRQLVEARRNLRMNDVYLYPYSSEEARRRDELTLWRASHQENIACKEAIEEAVRQHFDGSRLDNDCLTGVFQEFGYKRTAWVLANTLQQLEWDGRFSPKNKAWAEQFPIPWDKRHSTEFAVTSHPAVLDGVVDQYRKIYQELGLFGPEQCEPNSYSSLDYEGKVLVLSPDTLKESYWTPQAQLWYAHDGFGCSPHAIGRSVRCTCLGDGEMTRWNRTDFIGVLKEEFLPDWAEEKLKELRGQEQPAFSTDMTMK